MIINKASLYSSRPVGAVGVSWGEFRPLSGVGDVYVPTQFRGISNGDAPWKLFTNSELGQCNRIFTQLRRGGVAILSGDWERVTAVMAYIERKKNELIRPSKALERGRGRYQNRKGRGNDRRLPTQERADPMSRVMCLADEAGILQVNPPPDLPYLLEWVGENRGANGGRPFVTPVVMLQRIQSALAKRYPIRPLGISLLASENVLSPHSQETLELFQHGLRSVKPYLPPNTTVLDLGCGCGCITLLAEQEVGGPGVKIYASDLLPEAVATTRLNLRCVADAHGALPQINVMPAGDLFQPVSMLRFDLVIFNAPWVVSRARNRAEIAIHDERQNTLRRFFHDAPGYLNTKARLLIGYADASGTKAITQLEAMIRGAGLTVLNRFKQRVATHRAKGKWETITVYELVSGCQ